MIADTNLNSGRTKKINPMNTFRHFFLMTFSLLLAAGAMAQNTVYYVAAKSGLSIREKPDAAARVLEKIPYGAKLTLAYADERRVPISTEGMNGYWQKVTYNNSSGYVVDSYLFSWPPPKLATVKTMLAYLAQLSVPACPKLTYKSGTPETGEGWELKKQLYKNGTEWHEHTGYEYQSSAYFLPGFSLQQGFLLLRLIPEFAAVFAEKDEFPAQSKTWKKEGRDFELVVEKRRFDDYSWIEKIRIEYADGATYFFEMFMIDNQLVILYGAGV